MMKNLCLYSRIGTFICAFLCAGVSSANDSIISVEVTGLAPGQSVTLGYARDALITIPNNSNVSADSIKRDLSIPLNESRDVSIMTEPEGQSCRLDKSRSHQEVVTVHCTGASRRVIGWGISYDGQLNFPKDLTDVKAIAAGDRHSLALKNDGTLVGWGSNDKGQLNIPKDLTNVKAIAAGISHSLALKNDGTVVGWGNNDQGQLNIPKGLTNVKAIATWNMKFEGEPFRLISGKQNGEVIGWGSFYNDGFTYGDVFTFGKRSDFNVEFYTLTRYPGQEYSLALKNDGTVVGWGSNDKGQLDIPKDLTNVKAISAGADHVLALKADGTVVGWGSNSFGQLNIPDNVGKFTAIAAGAGHSLVLTTEGHVVYFGRTFGRDHYGKPDTGTAIYAKVEPGILHSLDKGELQALVPAKAIFTGEYSIILKKDGQALAWRMAYGTAQIPVTSNAKAISIGAQHTLAIINDESRP